MSINITSHYWNEKKKNCLMNISLSAKLPHVYELHIIQKQNKAQMLKPKAIIAPKANKKKLKANA